MGCTGRERPGRGSQSTSQMRKPGQREAACSAGPRNPAPAACCGPHTRLPAWTPRDQERGCALWQHPQVAPGPRSPLSDPAAAWPRSRHVRRSHGADLDVSLSCGERGMQSLPFLPAKPRHVCEISSGDSGSCQEDTTSAAPGHPGSLGGVSITNSRESGACQPGRGCHSQRRRPGPDRPSRRPPWRRQLRVCVWRRVGISRGDQRKAREGFRLRRVNPAMPSHPHSAAGGQLPCGGGGAHRHGPSPGQMPGLSRSPALSRAPWPVGRGLRQFPGSGALDGSLICTS